MANDLIQTAEEYDEGKLGPAMRRLTKRQRAFVIAMCGTTANGDLNHLEAARIAGYSGDNDTLKVTGYRLYHDERIRAAMLEAGGARLGGAVQVATGILVQLAQDPTAKSATRLKAIQMILNRAGLPEVTKHEVQVKRELSDTEKIERAVALAKSLGLDPRTLLGNVGVTLPAEPSPPQGEVTVEAEDIEIVASTSGIEDLLPPGFAL